MNDVVPIITVVLQAIADVGLIWLWLARKRDAAALDQACMNLATVRPLQVIKPGESLSLGECKDRWITLVREQVASQKR